MMTTRNVLLFLAIGLLTFFSGCKLSNDCSERKLVTALLGQMTLRMGNDGFLVDSDCLYYVAEVLEKISGYKRHTKFGHWGEFYDDTQTLGLDSLSYAYILAKLTDEELRQKVHDNDSFIVEVLNQGCLDNLQSSDYNCYLYFLNLECPSEINREAK